MSPASMSRVWVLVVLCLAALVSGAHAQCSCEGNELAIAGLRNDLTPVQTNLGALDLLMQTSVIPDLNYSKFYVDDVRERVAILLEEVFTLDDLDERLEASLNETKEQVAPVVANVAALDLLMQQEIIPNVNYSRFYVDDLRERVAAIQEEVYFIDDLDDKLELELNKTEEKLANTIDGVSVAVEGVEQELGALQAQVGWLRGNISNASAAGVAEQVAELDAKVDRLVGELQSDVDQVRTELMAALQAESDKVSALETKVDAELNTISTLQAELTKLRSDINPACVKKSVSGSGVAGQRRLHTVDDSACPVSGGGGGGSSSNSGAVVGGIIGGILGALLVGALVWYCMRRRKRYRPGVSMEYVSMGGLDGVDGLGAPLNSDQDWVTSIQ